MNFTYNSRTFHNICCYLNFLAHVSETVRVLDRLMHWEATTQSIQLQRLEG
jgi:hypothetical protein